MGTGISVGRASFGTTTSGGMVLFTGTAGLSFVVTIVTIATLVITRRGVTSCDVGSLAFETLFF